jgi:hypothetical protein
LPTFKRFNSAGYRRYRPPAGRGAFQSPLYTRTGDCSLEMEGEFLRSAFLFLQDDVYPATNKVGRARNKFRENFRKRCAPFRILRQGVYDVLVRIDPDNPSSSPRRVVWGEEHFKVVQALHEGEGHYGGAEKTRLKVADRYWFPQLTNFVREFVKTCNVCQKERVGAAEMIGRFFPHRPQRRGFALISTCVVPLKNWASEVPIYSSGGGFCHKVCGGASFKRVKVKGSRFGRGGRLSANGNLARYPGVYEFVTDRGGEFRPSLRCFAKRGGLNMLKLRPRIQKQMDNWSATCAPLNLLLENVPTSIRESGINMSVGWLVIYALLTRRPLKCRPPWLFLGERRFFPLKGKSQLCRP